MMNGVLLSALWLMPLLVIPLALRNGGAVWTVVATLPALVAAFALTDGAQIDIPWLLLGVQWGIDAQDKVFLIVAALLWSVAACYVRLWVDEDHKARRFRVFFLLAMSGNFGVIVSQDLVSFYLAFAVMGLAAYGLVVHGAQRQQRWAGKVYLAMTLLGELLLFVAFVLIYQRTGTLTPDTSELVGGGVWEVGLVIVAFAIKAGVVGVHFWLPLAYAAAPIPATAVMSGAMSKTALIGWFSFLPIGQQAMPEWGIGLVLLGSVAALLSVPVGLVQRNPKVLLAYSSIGKMGLMVAGLGVALLAPDLAIAIVAALVLFAAHHGLVKGALFLGIGVAKNTGSRWVIWLLALPALALAGAPFTSGALVKGRLSDALSGAGMIWSDVLLAMLLVAAFGTPLLMARFIYLLTAAQGKVIPKVYWQAAPWLILMALILIWPMRVGGLFETASAFIGLLVALVLAMGIWWRPPAAFKSWIGIVPPGDALIMLAYGWRRAANSIGVRRQAIENGVSQLTRLKVDRILMTGERLRAFPPQVSAVGYGPLWLGVTLILLLLMVW